MALIRAWRADEGEYVEIPRHARKNGTVQKFHQPSYIVPASFKRNTRKDRDSVEEWEQQQAALGYQSYWPDIEFVATLVRIAASSSLSKRAQALVASGYQIMHVPSDEPVRKNLPAPPGIGPNKASFAVDGMEIKAEGRNAILKIATKLHLLGYGEVAERVAVEGETIDIQNYSRYTPEGYLVFDKEAEPELPLHKLKPNQVHAVFRHSGNITLIEEEPENRPICKLCSIPIDGKSKQARYHDECKREQNKLRMRAKRKAKE